jgi:hypothetical protein
MATVSNTNTVPPDFYVMVGIPHMSAFAEIDVYNHLSLDPNQTMTMETSE